MKIGIQGRDGARWGKSCPRLGNAMAIQATIVATLLCFVPAHSYAARARSSSDWIAAAELLTPSHGLWRPARSVDSLGELRGVLTVHGEGLGRRVVTATMQMMHLSWQGFTKVILPPTVSVKMRRTSASAGTAVFTVDVQVPTLLPVYWSVVRFTVSDGHRRAEVKTGISVGGPARRTHFNTLTVPQAQQFCTAHSPLRYLSYAVYLHGYFAPVDTGGSDGPPVGIVFDRPRRVPAGGVPYRSYADSIFTGGFGLPRTGWRTVPGLLQCGDRKRVGFSASP